MKEFFEWAGAMERPEHIALLLMATQTLAVIAALTSYIAFIVWCFLTSPVIGFLSLLSLPGLILFYLLGQYRKYKEEKDIW